MGSVVAVQARQVDGWTDAWEDDSPTGDDGCNQVG